MGAVTSVYGWAQIAFGDMWDTASQTWTDVTDYLREFDVGWGRGGEYDQFRAGTCTIVLDNRDRRFEPGYPSSPYSPDVKAWVPLKVGVTFTDGVDTASQCLFSGFVERWNLDYPSGGQDATVRVEASDALKIPANYKLTVDLSSGLAGGMLSSAMTAFGWPDSTLWRTVGSGAVSLDGATAASTGSPVAALSLMNTVVQSDGGYLYSMPHSTAHTPRIVFRDRTFPQTGKTISCTFGESTGYTRYTDLKLVFDEERIRNRYRIGIVASTKTAVADDTGSQDQYGLRVYEQSGLLLATTGDAEDRATWGAHVTASPAIHGSVTGLLVAGMDYDRAVDLAVDAYEPLKWVTVRRGGLEEDMIVDACEVSYRVGEPCRFRYSMSPGNLAGEYWVLGDAALGVLDETAYLGW